MAEQLTATCPHCSGSKIAMVSRTFIYREVATFYRDNAIDEAFGVLPTRFTGEIVPDMDNLDSNMDFPWRCMDCKRELQDDDLVLQVISPTPTELREAS